MIEKMKKVCIVSKASEKQQMLTKLRALGLVHISDKKSCDSEISSRFEELSRVSLILAEYPKSEQKTKILSDKKFSALHQSVMDALSEKTCLTEEKTSLALQAENIKGWGDFDPQEVRTLCENTVNLYFYRMGKKEFAQLKQKGDVDFIKLSSVDKMETVAVLNNKLDKGFPAMEFELPQMGYSQLCQKIEQCNQKLSKCEQTIRESAKYLDSYKKQIVKCKNEISVSSVSNTFDGDDSLIWICGYIPLDDEKAFEKCAKANQWAYLIEDPSDDDEKIPTKVRYTKVTRLMKPVFDILGTIPGYYEYDISFWFLCFFTLFFAMIIGDAGYGLIFLLCAVGLNVKYKKANDTVLLLYVLSIANIVWGAVTGTWFGLESAMDLRLIKSLVIPSIANYPAKFGIDSITTQNNVMRFCFIIGTIQLSLACIMNIKTKIKAKNLSWLADLGWFSSINALYYVVLLLVIGADVNVVPAFGFVGLGFVLVVLFGGMSPDKTFAQGLKSGVANAFTVFLNTISAFGNVMSYIRLFAVGMASLAIAQSFNSMAGGFSGFLKIVGIVIFIIGHALNLVMGLLSVVVHGVRLNLLEFSGQLGMEWSGIAYEPFKEIKN